MLVDIKDEDNASAELSKIFFVGFSLVRFSVLILQVTVFYSQCFYIILINARYL